MSVVLNALSHNKQSWKASRRCVVASLLASAASPLLCAMVLLIIRQLTQQYSPAASDQTRFPFEICSLAGFSAMACLPCLVLVYYAEGIGQDRIGVKILKTMRWIAAGVAIAIYAAHFAMWSGFYFSRMGSTDVVVAPLSSIALSLLSMAVGRSLHNVYLAAAAASARKGECKHCGYSLATVPELARCPECGEADNDRARSPGEDSDRSP